MRKYHIILALCTLLGLRAGFSQPVTGGFSVATTNREAVRTFYNAVFGHWADVRPEWSGDPENCDPGSTSADYRVAVLTRINFFRAMAGVPAVVTFNDDYSLRAQHAAMILSVNEAISHSPDESWSCYTELGAEGAYNANVAIGSAGQNAIESYIMDAGPNSAVAHRRWLIYPKTQEMGTGDIEPPDGSELQRANAVWIFDDHFTGPRPPTRERFVAWPPPGYVPHRLVYPRWSFQISGADFSGAVVTMASNGVPVAVQKEQVAPIYGENAIVWVPHGIATETRMFWPKPAEDVTYGVAITNIVLSNGRVTNYNYNVIVIDPERPEEQWAGARPLGSSAPRANRINSYTIPAYPNASSYDLRASILTNDLARLDAESEEPGIVASVSGLYELIQTNIVASGERAFRLVHTRPARNQWFMLDEAVLPSSETELQFQSRIAAAQDEIARVEVSLDEGSSWQEVYAQAGDPLAPEMTFTRKSVSLSRFAGRAIWIRFNFGLVFGPAAIARMDHGIGWFIDEIEITQARRLVPVQVTSTTLPELAFVPAAIGEYYLDARARFYQDYTGVWSLGTVVNAVEPDPAFVWATSIRMSSADLLEIELDASGLPPDARLYIETAPTIAGPWRRQSDVQMLSTARAGAFKAITREAERAAFFRIAAE